MQIGATVDDFSDVLLHISAQAFPALIPAAEHWQVMKVLMLGGEREELVVVVNIFFGAAAEEQPELLVLMARVVREEPLQHRAVRRDARAGRDEDRIAQ